MVPHSFALNQDVLLSITNFCDLSRVAQKSGLWRSHQHGGRDLGKPKQNVVLESQGTCVKCSKTLSAGISPIVCSHCPNLSLAVCTKITIRGEILKKRDGRVSWQCSFSCDTETESKNSTPPPWERSECLKCKGTICQGEERMRCHECYAEITRVAHHASMKSKAC